LVSTAAVPALFVLSKKIPAEVIYIRGRLRVIEVEAVITDF
jgi:hypothetical protein